VIVEAIGNTDLLRQSTHALAWDDQLAIYGGCLMYPAPHHGAGDQANIDWAPLPLPLPHRSER
jgi:hypothetical protein